MADVKAAVGKLLDLEGGRPVADDNRAGPARWGVTARLLGQIGGWDGIKDPRELTREQAAAIYEFIFCRPLRLAEIKDQRVAEALLICAANVGVPRAVRELQTALRDCGDWTVAVDGIMGLRTLHSINRLGQRVLPAFRRRMENYYRWLAARDPDLYADDLRGWLRRLEVACSPG